MSNKRKSSGRNRRSEPALKPAQLRDGMSAGTGYRIRLARPGEADIIQTLLAHAGAPMDDEQAAVLDSGGTAISAGLLTAMTTKQPFDSLARTLTTHAASGDLFTGMLGLGTLLVATTLDDEVVAAADAHPPGHVLRQAIDAGVDQNRALFGALTVIKISGIAVDPDHRGRRLGSHLLKRCAQLYFQLGYQLAYGQFTAADGLDGFYTGHGFQLLEPHSGISLEERLMLPVNLGPDHGERMFYKWNRT